MAVFDVRPHPHPLPSLRAELCGPAAAVRQPGYLPARRPLGFAPPPHDGFAFLASAHGWACPATNTPYIGSQLDAILLQGLFLQMDDAPRVALWYARALSDARLITSGR